MHPLPASAKVAPGPRSPAGRRALLHGGEKLLWLPPASHMSLEVAMGGLEQGISSVCFKAKRTPLPDTHTHTPSLPQSRGRTPGTLSRERILWGKFQDERRRRWGESRRPLGKS